MMTYPDMLRSIAGEADRLSQAEAWGAAYAPCLDDDDGAALREAADHIETLEAALRTIQNTCARYIHPEGTMTAEEFIDEVLGAADNRDLVKAMGTSGDGSAMVNKALEKGR